MTCARPLSGVLRKRIHATLSRKLAPRLGYSFELWHRGLIPDRFIFFTRHLTGLNESGLHTKLRQNNRLKQEPDNHHPNDQQQPFHGTIPR
jgi:hypothetical protein